jgi:hypothetical protein
MPLYLDSLVDIAFSIIITNVSFYILPIPRPSKELESLLYSIVSGYWVVIIKLYNFLIQSGIIRYNDSGMVPE